MTTWSIIDVSCLIWQEFYGAGNRSALASIIGGVDRARELASAVGSQCHTIWCLDQGPYYRQQLLPGYKGSRTSDPEKDALRTLCRSVPGALVDSGLKNVRWYTGLEADDHVAAAVSALPPSDKAVIISRDKDLHQLLSSRVSQQDPVTSEWATLGGFRAQFGLHPSEYADVKAITGCSTDDVPGVAGVGEVTAAKYLRGDLNKLGATWGKIDSWVRSDGHALNLSLVRLPFAGTPKPPLTADAGLTPRAWDRFTEAIGEKNREQTEHH